MFSLDGLNRTANAAVTRESCKDVQMLARSMPSDAGRPSSMMLTRRATLSGDSRVSARADRRAMSLRRIESTCFGRCHLRVATDDPRQRILRVQGSRGDDDSRRLDAGDRSRYRDTLEPLLVSGDHERMSSWSRTASRSMPGRCRCLAEELRQAGSWALITRTACRRAAYGPTTRRWPREAVQWKPGALSRHEAGDGPPCRPSR